MVDLVGIEPTTSSMPWKRAPKLRHRPTFIREGLSKYSVLIVSKSRNIRQPPHMPVGAPMLQSFGLRSFRSEAPESTGSAGKDWSRCSSLALSIGIFRNMGQHEYRYSRHHARNLYCRWGRLARALGGQWLF